jgi:Methyltransferase domain
VRAVLDYGCGRGADVDYSLSLGVDAVGYDPHVPFGFAESPTGLFMVVTLIFVLNVLPTVEARLEVLRGAAVRLAPDGVLIVATRSAAAVRNEAARRGWRACGDGFVSHQGRGTFQHGMDIEELADLGEMLGLRPQGPLPTVRDASIVALTRQPPPTQSAWPRTELACDRTGSRVSATDRQTRAECSRAGDRLAITRGLCGVIAWATTRARRTRPPGWPTTRFPRNARDAST